ncbi:MAG TPA: hypothetical protein VND21_08525 [Planctomycetota bacterium]|nr:hypothetical protein [Planctomycetota bacterium]
MTRARVPLYRLLLCACLLAGGTRAAKGADPADRNEPWIGYAYPAGGRAGTVVRVWVGGQNLKGASSAIVSGGGVDASVVEWIPAFRMLDFEEARELRRRLEELRAAKMGLPPRPPPPVDPAAEPERRVKLPEHPFLRDLETQSLERLAEIATYFFTPRERQQEKRAIAETTWLDVRVDAAAAPGPRELRLLTPVGLSNPLRFDVGTLPEVVEREPNGPEARARAAVLDLPIVLNGQILPRDTDRFRFRARAGQRLVIEALARRLVPYQADSVPGWMQTVVAVLDAKGREVAWGDDWRGGPDPVVLFEVPQDGEYALEVRDAIHRGREDFVYRVVVAERPFVTAAFPLGAREGEPGAAELTGWNLRGTWLPFDTREGRGRLRTGLPVGDPVAVDPVAYAVDPLPEAADVEPNDTAETAQATTLPRVVNGRIDRPGDVDDVVFHGIVGQVVVVEVLARRLGSPLDSVVRLVDPTGRVVAWNDDHPDPTFGLMTHAADSWFLTKLDREGKFHVRIADAQGHGGPDHGYRLRIGPPQPDFSLVVTPASVNVRAGRAEVVTAHVVRRDGFDGDVVVSLASAPSGFVLSGGVVPAGRDRVRMTLAGPAAPRADPVPLVFEGKAVIAGRDVVRTGTPADDVMQAFAWRHLVPAQAWLATVTGAGRDLPLPRWEKRRPVRLPHGGRATVRLEGLPRGSLARVHFDLDDPPAGVTLDDVREEDGGVVLVLKSDRKTAVPGAGDNLIVEVYAGPAAPRAPGPRVRPPPERYLGVLPALPIEAP